MARRIVPDASVIVAFHFPEVIEYRGAAFNLTRRATQVTNDIWDHKVEAFAPEMLHHEFLTRAHRDVAGRHGSTDALSRANEAIELFSEMPLIFVRGDDLLETVWQIAVAEAISIADAWYLACAIYCDAELWVSHEHEDGFVAAAKRLHDRVFTLTQDSFR